MLFLGTKLVTLLAREQKPELPTSDTNTQLTGWISKFHFNWQNEQLVPHLPRWSRMQKTPEMNELETDKKILKFLAHNFFK